MKLLDPSKYRKEKQLWMAEGLILLVATLFSLFWLTVLCLQKEQSVSSSTLPLPRLDYHCVGRGPLAISPRSLNPAFEPLVQELVLLGKNSRPDAGSLSRICLGLKSSGSKQELISGQKLFLEHNPSYRFSEKETGLSLLPLAMTGSEVLLQIETAAGEKEEIVLTPSPLFQRSLDEESYVQCLRKAKMWAPDLFLHQWGGDEYRNLSAKHKIEIENKVYFLSIGDALWWDGSEWTIGTPVLAEAPLAKVVSVTTQGSTLEVWDPTGYFSATVAVPLQPRSKVPLKAEEVITSVRPRALAEITCQLGKRRVIVKEGDWWIKTDKRWRSLKSAADLEAFLHHDIQGELFMFEKIENIKGKITLKGRCFDKMRTESQPLSLVVNTEKKSPSPRKSESSNSSLLAKNKMSVPPLQHQNSDGEEK